MRISITGSDLKTSDIAAVAHQKATVKLSDAALNKIRAARDFLHRRLESAEPIYGVNTGFGGAFKHGLAKSELKEMQVLQMRSHAAGIGDPMPKAHVRAAMLTRINTHSQGASACRPVITQTLVDMLNKGVHPIVPKMGSVGASGDLAPMSHVGLTMIGEGEAEFDGHVLPSADAMTKAKIALVDLEVRDTLALINGSNFISGIGSLLVDELEAFLKNFEIAAALSIEGLLGAPEAFDARIHAIRGFPGAMASAENLRKLLKDSPRWKEKAANLQDAYSLRATPQVVGSVRDALRYAKTQCEIEINGAGDNPLFFPEDNAILTGANFLGTPVSLPLDMLSTAVTSSCVQAERRINRLLNPALSEGLPLFLMPKPGVNTGYMTSQYTADALIARQRLLSTPASIHSISASADQEDYVSMGLHAAQKLDEVLDCAWGVLAIECLCGAQAIDLRGCSMGQGTSVAHAKIRDLIPHLCEDRVHHVDHEKTKTLLKTGELLKAVEASMGALKTYGEDSHS